ncbi:hypothetical protein DPMN_045215 [Dreissena polymorpha]|uniref:Uncharacterized protein n=1 Tax=Dreissena polymorpha TaxID=45954 RepID=A0A9D4HZP3_DREPO|nr:hypothetical protein DPMN_045215 [Dreissena polymorpha]
MEKAAGRKMKNEEAITLQRSLRTIRDNDLAEKWPKKLKNEHKRQKKQFKDIDEPQLMDKDLSRNRFSVKIKIGTLFSKFRAAKKTYQSSSLTPDDNHLMALIQEQS